MDTSFVAKELPRVLFPRRFSPINDMQSLNLDEAGTDQGDPNGARHLYLSIAFVIILLGIFGAISLFLEFSWTRERAAREVCLDRCERGMEETRGFLDQEKAEESSGQRHLDTETIQEQQTLAGVAQPQPQPKIIIRITAA